MNQKKFLSLITIVFFAIGLGHFARITYGLEASIGGVSIPMEVSYLFVLAAAYLFWKSWLFYRKSK